jgi:hypothetical protein
LLICGLFNDAVGISSCGSIMLNGNMLLIHKLYRIRQKMDVTPLFLPLSMALQAFGQLYAHRTTKIQNKGTQT